MKNKILLILLVLFPVMVNGACNEAKHKEYVEIAKNITYDNHFDKLNGRYTFTLYNITEDMYGIYGKNKFLPDSENKIELKSVAQGTNISISVYVNDGCDPIAYFGLTEPYFNPYYKSDECFGFEELAECSKEFTSSKVTKESLEMAKYYHYKNYGQGGDNKNGNENDKSLIDIIKEYIRKWWVKVLLSVVTTLFCVWVYRIRIRKIKHGI